MEVCKRKSSACENLTLNDQEDDAGRLSLRIFAMKYKQKADFPFLTVFLHPIKTLKNS